MDKVISVKYNVASLEMFPLFLLPTLQTKLREEESDLLAGRLVTVRAMTDIASVSQTKPPPHRLRVTEPSPEHLGGSHQLPPPSNAVSARQDEGLAGSAAHEGDQPVIEEFLSVLFIELLGPRGGEVYCVAPDHQEVAVQDHLLDPPVIRGVLEQVWLQYGESQLEVGGSDSAQ